MIEEYVKNTHASTHTQYSLEIAEVFKVARKGEAKRFKPFRALPNRMLLWHGSRVTNFAGILSQGLRIAPPEVSYHHFNFVVISSSIHFNFRHRSLDTCLEKEYTSPIWFVFNWINTIKFDDMHTLLIVLCGTVSTIISILLDRSASLQTTAPRARETTQACFFSAM